MTRILAPGAIKVKSGEDGYILLRSLIVMFVVILCFAAVLIGMGVFSRRSAVLLENAEKEIQRRNERTGELLK
jgi:type II secretory pathway pseudopilin PulG